MNTSCINAVLKGRQITHGKFCWEYAKINKKIEGEKWKKRIINDREIKISNMGRIKSNVGKILKGSNDKGYIRVSINDKKYFVHRLVGEAFLPNPDDLPTINHINEDKADNRAENLEWASLSHQQIHSLPNRMKHTDKGRVVSQWKGGKLIATYPTIAKAARESDCSDTSIQRALSEGVSVKGYK